MDNFKKYSLYSALVLVWLSLLGSCRYDDVAQPVPYYLWQKLNVPYFGALVDIQFISSDIGYIMGRDTDESTIIIKTKNGGVTWQKLYFSYLADTSNLRLSIQLDVSPFNSNILFSLSNVSNQNVCVRSTDGGYHWKITDTTINSAWGRYHFFSPANVVRSGEFIYASSDSGFTWTKVYGSTPGDFANFTMLQFTSSQTGYTSGGIFFDATNFGQMAKTIDGGNSWQDINYPFHNIQGMSFVNDNVGYVVMQMDSGNLSVTYPGGTDLSKTEDGGVTWHTVRKNILYGYSYSRDLYFKDELEGFVLGGSAQVYHTTDGGKIWRNESPSPNIITNLFFPNLSCCYAIDNKGNVYKRTFQ